MLCSIRYLYIDVMIKLTDFAFLDHLFQFAAFSRVAGVAHFRYSGLLLNYPLP